MTVGTGLQSVRDLLAALAVERFAVAIGHREQIALDDIIPNRSATHVGRIVRAWVADNRRHLFHVRHMRGRPCIRSGD